jgi:glycosyltransferase involved in cell wall biosynthesis
MTVPAIASRALRPPDKCMYCSVIIPTYNRRKTLERTLEGVLAQSVGSEAYEVIVVDDGSVDDTPEYMATVRERALNLTYIRHDLNRGRPETRNDGIRAARGEIVILLDDDNVPVHGFVEAHRRAHEESGDERIVVMGNVRFAPEVVQGGNFARFLESRYLGSREPGERAGLDYGNLPARCFGTGNASIRRSDLLAVGLLDERFRFYGGEDEYLGYCLTRAGVRIVFGEDARSLHYDEVTIGRYRVKLLEAARLGLRILMDNCPDYVESTQVRFLMPIRIRADRPSVIAAKMAMRLVTCTPSRILLEQWAVLTDRIRWLYCWPVYRALSAAWIAYGYRTQPDGKSLVTYGESGRNQ